MSMSFASPSMRAAGQDLSVSISPLGLVELSDEEFEVHGPRLNRYAQSAAFYLGHHYAYKRAQGEPQIAHNYVRALADWTNNFCFGKGVTFKTAPEYEAIIPGLLKQVWEVHNDKQALLWDIANNGGIYGDAFVKVAWEPERVDDAGYVHPGRVVILPLNPAYCYPEFHPHDRDRMMRFKLKYRFWGTAPEGTRQVFTYCEILTAEWIEEYINDELIAQRPNPLGEIPVVHIRNNVVSGSPWGLSDVADILPLNREYNEKMLEISDGLNYHVNPITIVTGGTMNQATKGANKVWNFNSKDVQVFNLEAGVNGLPVAMEYVEVMKRTMHELTGVPESALGQMQPISNTSGVALSIMYQPAMLKRQQKLVQYTKGFKAINKFILKTLFEFQPQTLMYDPTTEGVITDPAVQKSLIDPRDPLAYECEVHWPSPLPIDALVVLNEIQLEMALGLESKKGALAKLGNEFPEEKLQEIFKELVEDAKMQGSLDMVRAKIASVIAMVTGMIPGEEPQPLPQASTKTTTKNGTTGNSKTVQQTTPINPLEVFEAQETQKMLQQLLTQAYGSSLLQVRRMPDSDKEID